MWPNPQEPADLVTFTDEILNVKHHFLCSVRYVQFGKMFSQGHVDSDVLKNGMSTSHYSSPTFSLMYNIHTICYKSLLSALDHFLKMALEALRRA